MMAKKKKDIIEKLAQKAGQSPKEYIEENLYKFPSAGDFGKSIGLSNSWLSRIMRKHGCGLGKGGGSKKYRAIVAQWNRDHDTKFHSLGEIIAELSETLKTAEIMEILGVKKRTVEQALYQNKRQERNASARGYAVDYMRVKDTWGPCNVPGPWTDPENSPCSVCQRHLSGCDKNTITCYACKRKEEYMILSAGLPALGCGGESRATATYSTWEVPR
jgi:hypothetical protein